MGYRDLRRLVERVDVASPCTSSWDEMSGDERKSYCGRCQKHVYNLSAMSSDEAEALIYETKAASASASTSAPTAR